jgi:primosomal protein N' (replication factor Y)
VKTGRYQLLRLENRVTAHTLPTVEIVDQKKTTMTGLLSSTLIREMEKMLIEKKQTMLLLNRRGFASHVHCEDCGFVPECPNCSVSLTLYASKRELRCHYCGHANALAKNCPKCSSEKLETGSPGTEALEQTVQEVFPHARTLRVDRDSMKGKDVLENALLKVTRGDVDIVIGTQMIAKGHDFPNVGLVGVVNSDASFHFPDFRSSERSFQLFTQMAGRAGRGNFEGKVLLQTYTPEHPSVLFAAQHDFRSFAEQELQQRLAFQYPPYTRLARLLISDPSNKVAQQLSEAISKDLASFAGSGVAILGPAPSLLQRLQNRFRWNIILKSKESAALNSLLKTALLRWSGKIGSTASLSVDVDPSSLF